MKKFKNRIKVLGPSSLLEAFAKELDGMGYTRALSHFNLKVNNAIITEWDMVSGTYGFTTKSHPTRSHETITLTLPQDWDKALELAREEEIELKPGKWYVDEYNTIFRYNHEGDGDNVGAINNDSLLAESLLRYRCCNNGNFRPATPEEIKEHLTKLANHKGYKPGTQLRAINPYSYKFTLCDQEPNYLQVLDHFYMGGLIYKEGEWAEIVEEIPEYVECVESRSCKYTKGRIYKVNNENGYVINNDGRDRIATKWDNTSHLRSKFKPSTKEAYEKQNKVLFAGRKVCFEDGHIKIGCQRIDNEFVLSLNKLLHDEFKIVQRTPDGDEDVMDEFSNIVSHIKRSKP